MTKAEIAEIIEELDYLRGRIETLERSASSRGVMRKLALECGNNKQLFMAKLKQEMEDRIAQSAANFIENMDKMIHNQLSNATSRILGFDPRGRDGWEIDRCNGRSSTVSEYVSARAKKVVKEEIDKIWAEDEIKKAVERAKASVIANLSREVEYDLRDRLRELTKNLCERYVKSIVDSVEKDLKVISTDFDIASPENIGPVQEALLKKIAESVKLAEENQRDV